MPIDKKNQKPKKSLLKYLLIWGILWEFLGLVKKKDKLEDIEDNFKNYLKKEEKEIESYVENKEGFSKFWWHSERLFKDFFIPCHGNNHKPKILRTNSLTLIVVIMALLKISIALYVFYFTAYQAKMSENMTSQILELVNRDRVAQNLQPLAINSVLNSSALSKAQNMVANNYFAHYSPDGKKPWDFIDRNAYAYLFVGENLAMNFTSAESAHQALMLSPTHKENIMNEKYRDIGLAIVAGEIAGKNTNVLVQLFAQKTEPTVKLATIQKTEEKKTLPVVSVNQVAIEEKPEIKKVPDQNIAPVIKNEVAKSSVKVEPEIKVEEKKEVLKIEEKLPPLPNLASLEKLPIPVLENTLEKNNIAEAEGVGKFPLAENQILSEEEMARLNENGSLMAKAEASPNVQLENNLITQVKSFDNIPDEDIISSDRRMTLINNIMLFILAALFLLLIVNIIIKAEIQHKPVIVQTLLAIICLTGLIYLNFNFLENVLPKLFIV